MPDDLDFDLRRAALEHVRVLSQRFDDLIPVDALRAGFSFDGQRVSFGSFYSGIFRPSQCRGPAALTLTTTPPNLSRDAPYDDGYDAATDSFVYHYRAARQPTAAARRAADADNRALRAAHQLAVPVIYFHGIAPGQYSVVAPVFVTEDDRGAADRAPRGGAADRRRHLRRPGLDTRAAPLMPPAKPPDRLHQHRFRGSGPHRLPPPLCGVRAQGSRAPAGRAHH